MENPIDFRDHYGYGNPRPKEELPADLAVAMSQAVNRGMLRISDAETFVKTLKHDHRTLQAGVMNFFLAVVKEYGQQVGETNLTDPRNKTIAETCSAIRKMDLDYNPLI